mgnify:CR=1 FL=1
MTFAVVVVLSIKRASYRLLDCFEVSFILDLSLGVPLIAYRLTYINSLASGSPNEDPAPVATATAVVATLGTGTGINSRNSNCNSNPRNGVSFSNSSKSNRRNKVVSFSNSSKSNRSTSRSSILIYFSTSGIINNVSRVPSISKSPK